MLRFMEITEAQYLRIAPSLPRQRGNVRISNRQVLNALWYVAEHGCKWGGPRATGKSRGGWTTKIHLVAADARTAITFALSPGQASDAVEGRALLAGIGPLPAPMYLILDQAYEDNQTLQLALDFAYLTALP